MSDPKDQENSAVDQLEVSSRGKDSGFIAAHRRPFALFIVFGCINSLISYLVYVVALLILPYGIAYTIAYVVGIFTSYLFNSKFVFRRAPRLSAALQYPVSYLVQYVVGLFLLYLLVKRAGMSEYLAPFVTAVLLVPVGYVVSRFVINR